MPDGPPMTASISTSDFSCVAVCDADDNPEEGVGEDNGENREDCYLLDENSGEENGIL